MKSNIFNKNGNNLDNVALDLGRNGGTSSREVVVTALDRRKRDGYKVAHLEDHKRLLQQTLGVNPTQEMLDLFQRLSNDDRELFLKVWRVIKQTFDHTTIPKTLGVQQYEDVIRLKDIEYSKHEDEFEKSIREANSKVASLRSQVEQLSVSIHNATQTAQNEVSQNIRDVKTSAEGQIKDFITSHTAMCEDLESKLKEILSRATIGRLSAQFEEKKQELKGAYDRAKKFFYSSLTGFAILGLSSVFIATKLATEAVRTDYGSWAMFAVMPEALLKLLPFYVTLFWYTCHVNRLMNQNRRLMEEYAHKVVVAQTYTGIEGQIEELEKKGVIHTKSLSQDLLDRTIQVLCNNPNAALDKVKTQTPISEIADTVSKLVLATSELKKGSDLSK